MRSRFAIASARPRRAFVASPLLRLLAVTWMLLYSPAMCCCGVRSALTTVAGSLTVPTGATAAVADSAVDRPGRCPHCAATEIRSAAPVDGAPASACHCHEMGREALTGGTLALAMLDLSPLAVLGVPASAILPPLPIARACAHVGEPPPPVLASLVAHRCKLTI